MKNKKNPSFAEIGAGTGLIFVSMVVILLDSSQVPYVIMNISLGLMIATGLFSSNSSKTKCIKTTAKNNHEKQL